MPLQAGYHYIELGTLVFTRNPTTDRDPRAEKPIARVKTLTTTVTQHWPITDKDKEIYLEWANLDKTTLDTLKTMYVTDNQYVFKDVYGASHNVVISNLEWNRKTMLDVQGFSVILQLAIV